MTILVALASVVVLAAIIGWDIFRGRTALGGLTFQRGSSGGRYWGALGVYAGGAAIIFLSTAYLTVSNAHCDRISRGDLCAVTIQVPLQ